MSDGLPGDYDSIDGLKKRARALENWNLAHLIERAEERVECVDGGYRLRNPPDDADDREMWFHIVLLTGAALEREYPAPDDN